MLLLFVTAIIAHYRALRGPQDAGWQFAAARRSFEGLRIKLT